MNTILHTYTYIRTYTLSYKIVALRYEGYTKWKRQAQIDLSFSSKSK